MNDNSVTFAQRWRARLFSDWPSGITTVLIALVGIKIVSVLWQWFIAQATWHGLDRKACTTDGACWAFVHAKWRLFLFGFYPPAEQWRPWCVYVGLIAIVVPCLWFWQRFSGRVFWAILLGFAVVAGILLRGGMFGLVLVPAAQWGGLLLSLLLATTAMLLSLPGGIILALGRRSRLPFVRWSATLVIEVCRGVPLITMLFMASVMLPLFLPQGWEFDKLARAIVGLSVFTSAYMAEVIRGGLNIIPRGQYEAASALGLTWWHSTRLIVLPQALRAVVPGITNTFISLFKDTSLVLIIGMFDLLGMVQAALMDPAWLGLAMEAYVVAGVIYGVLCWGIARLGERFEVQRVTL